MQIIQFSNGKLWASSHSKIKDWVLLTWWNSQGYDNAIDLSKLNCIVLRTWCQQPHNDQISGNGANCEDTNSDENMPIANEDATDILNLPIADKSTTRNAVKTADMGNHPSDIDDADIMLSNGSCTATELNDSTNDSANDGPND